MAEVQAHPADTATAVDPVSSVGPDSAHRAADRLSGANPASERSAAGVTREEFWNLPNTITMFRIAVVPTMLLLPFALSPRGSAVIAWCFIVAALSDIVDGWLARRGQQVTHIGKLLDPLADKLLVSTALVMLVAVDRLESWATWMVVVIIGRELAVTGLRSIASAGGHVMAANWHGKLKATCQNIAIAALLLHYPTLGLPMHEIGLGTLFLATLLTLWSGYKYFESYFASGGIASGGIPDAAANREVKQ